MVGERQDPPRVLVIGWGFIGAAIGHCLLAGGISVAGLTRSHTAGSKAGVAAGAHIVVGDASQPQLLEQTLRGIDHVVFSVGGLSPPATALEPGTAVVKTLLPLLCVLEALRQRPHIALTYLSSGGTVYGNPARLPVHET